MVIELSGTLLNTLYNWVGVKFGREFSRRRIELLLRIVC